MQAFRSDTAKDVGRTIIDVEGAMQKRVRWLEYGQRRLEGAQRSLCRTVVWRS